MINKKDNSYLELLKAIKSTKKENSIKKSNYSFGIENFDSKGNIKK